MRHLIHIATALLLSALAASCSGNSSTGNGGGTISEADSAYYRMGRNDATLLLQQCRTTNDVRDRLLEIRARETDLRLRHGDPSAQAFIQGFTAAIKESGDTLAHTLF